MGKIVGAITLPKPTAEQAYELWRAMRGVADTDIVSEKDSRKQPQLRTGHAWTGSLRALVDELYPVTRRRGASLATLSDKLRNYLADIGVVNGTKLGGQKPETARWIVADTWPDNHPYQPMTTTTVTPSVDEVPEQDSPTRDDDLDVLDRELDVKHEDKDEDETPPDTDTLLLDLGAGVEAAVQQMRDTLGQRIKELEGDNAQLKAALTTLRAILGHGRDIASSLLDDESSAPVIVDSERVPELVGTPPE